MPELDSLRAAYASRGVKFLAVSLEPDTRRVRVAAERLKLQIPLATAESELLGPLQLETVPATFFVDPHGTIVSRVNGAESRAGLAKRIDALLAGAPNARH